MYCWMDVLGLNLEHIEPGSRRYKHRWGERHPVSNQGEIFMDTLLCTIYKAILGLERLLEEIGDVAFKARISLPIFTVGLRMPDWQLHFSRQFIILLASWISLILLTYMSGLLFFLRHACRTIPFPCHSALFKAGAVSTLTATKRSHQKSSRFVCRPKKGFVVKKNGTVRGPLL